MQRNLIILTVVTVIVLTILAVLFWVQRNRALHQLVLSELAQATTSAELQAQATTQAEDKIKRNQEEAAKATAVMQAQATAQAQAEQSLAEAEARYKTLLAQKLSVQAQLQLNDAVDPTLGILLAAESLKRLQSVEADIAIRRGIELMSGRQVFTNVVGDCVRSTSLSADGQRLAVFTSNCRYYEKSMIVKVWNIKTNQELASFTPGDDDEFPVKEVGLSADGHWLAMKRRCYTCDESYKIEVVAVDTNQQVLQAESPSWAFSPDSRWVALINSDNAIGIWDLSTQQILTQLKHEQKVGQMVFSPDGRWMVSQNENQIWLWDVKDYKLVHEISAQDSSVCFSPDSRFLAVIDRGNPVVRIWAVAPWQEIAQVGQGTLVNEVEFIPGADKLVSLSHSGNVQVWDLSNKTEITSLSLRAKKFDSIAMSFDGLWLATSGEATQLWETKTWQERTRIPRSHFELVFSADSKRLVLTGGSSFNVEVWEIQPSKLALVEISVGEWPRALTFSPDGKWVAATGDYGAMWIWEATTGRELVQTTDSGTRLVFSPDSKWVITNGVNNTRVWEVPDGREIKHVGHNGKGEGVAISPDGRLVASYGDSPEEIKVWELVSGQEVAQLDPPNIGDNNFVFSPDSQLLVSGGGSPTIIWKVTTGEKIAQLPFDSSYRKQAISFSPDGRFLAVGNQGTTITVWDIKTNQEVAQLKHTYPNEGFRTIGAVAFSPDGQWLATSTVSEFVQTVPGEGWEVPVDVRIWAVAGWQQIAQMEAGVVDILAFSPDSRWLVTEGNRIWEVTTGREVAQIPHEDSFITAFSPDGRLVATAGYDTVRIWAWPYWQAQNFIKQACTHLPRNLTQKEWQQYLGDEPYQATCPDLPTLQN